MGFAVELRQLETEDGYSGLHSALQISQSENSEDTRLIPRFAGYLFLGVNLTLLWGIDSLFNAAVREELLPFTAALCAAVVALSVFADYRYLLSPLLTAFKGGGFGVDICRTALCLLVLARFIAMPIESGVFPSPSDFFLEIIPLVLLLGGAEQLLRFFARQWEKKSAIFLRSRVRPSYESNEESGIASVPINEILVGTEYVVRPGDVIPCDSIVSDRILEVSECRLSGRTRRVVRGAGDTVYGGSSVEIGTARLKALGLPDEASITFAEDVVRPVIQCDAFRVEREAFRGVEQLAVFAVFFLAAVATVAWTDRGVPLHEALLVSQAVLVVATLLRPLKLSSLFTDCAVVRLFLSGTVVKAREGIEKLAKANALLIDAGVRPQLESLEVREFSLLDRRLDEAGLLSGLFAIFSRSEEPIDRVIAAHVRGLLKQPTLLRVLDFRSYGQEGLSAVVEGAEFTVGSEALLIERGVKVAPGDVEDLSQEGRLILVALEDEVVARIVVGDAFRQEAQLGVHTLSQGGVRTVVYGEGAAEIGAAFAIESGDILSAREPERVVERIRPLVTAVVSDRPAQPLRDACSIWISYFDELKFEVDKSDVTVFPTGFAPLAQLIKISRYCVSAQHVALWSSGILAVTLLACAVTSMAPAWIVLLSAFFFHAFVALSILVAV